MSNVLAYRNSHCMLPTFSVHDGWLLDTRQVDSPNADERPPDTAVELLVIHCISLPPGEYGGSQIERFFTNQLRVDDHPYFAEIAELKVSAHLLIDRQGELVQFVNFNRRAWHAGQSCYYGRECCNDFSVGIELEGLDDQPFTEAQYRVLAGVSRALLGGYPGLSVEAIVGHEDIAPGRKTDPGPGFDWQYFRRLLMIDSTQEVSQ